MSSYSFTVEHPPRLKETGSAFIVNNPEVHDKMHSYKITFGGYSNGAPPLTDLIPNFDASLLGIVSPEAYIILKRQKMWIKTFGPVTLAGKETRTIKETISQSLTESRSLRALIRVSASGEVNAPFVSVSTELTAEVEGTIAEQQSWTNEKEITYEKTLEPHRTYAFWHLVDRISVIYDLGELIRAFHMFDKLDARQKASFEQVKKLHGTEKQFDTLLYSMYEDSMDDEKALLLNLAASS